MTEYEVEPYEEGMFKLSIKDGDFKDHVIVIRDIKMLENGTADIEYSFLTEIDKDNFQEDSFKELLSSVVENVLTKKIKKVMKILADSIDEKE